MLPHHKGGLRIPPSLNGMYRPHIVIGDPEQREPILGRGRTIIELYLGVQFGKQDVVLLPERPTKVVLDLIYFPEISYEQVVPMATFTIREGPKIVGFGSILTVHIK